MGTLLSVLLLAIICMFIVCIMYVIERIIQKNHAYVMKESLCL